MPSDTDSLQSPAVDPALWPLEPDGVFLNHGSFGACPVAVLERQREIRERMERAPMRFFLSDFETFLDEARTALAKFVGAEREHLVFVPNATAGVNSVLRSLRLKKGDELLVTDHEYNASRNALDFVARDRGAAVVVAEVPFPLQSPDAVLEALTAKVSPRTRLLLVDHVTSQTGMILPLERIIAEMEACGVDVLVDGAHAPGMIPLELEKLGASYYTGNCHKWICSPKGAGLLYVRPDKQANVRPLAISHGANSPRTDRSRFLIEFGWTGTWDASPMLTVPFALEYMAGLLPGGWPAVRERNRALALAARELLCGALSLPPPCPAGMIGSLASLPLPPSKTRRDRPDPLFPDPLQRRLLDDHNIEALIVPWPRPPRRCLRVSAQLYNSLPQYRKLAELLRKHLKDGD